MKTKEKQELTADASYLLYKMHELQAALEKCENRIHSLELQVYLLNNSNKFRPFLRK